MTGYRSGDRIQLTDHADYTKGALYASTTGIPYYMEIAGAGMYKRGFINDALSLGDILGLHGYKNEFICGSDGDFGGRADYFKKHGDYKIMDYYAAIEKGYIPRDYNVWWGYEDKKLYEISKSEITKLAASKDPMKWDGITDDSAAPNRDYLKDTNNE